MHPIFHSFQQEFSLSDTNTGQGTIFRPRTNGMVYQDHVSYSFREVPTITAQSKRSVGAFLAQPEEDDFTPYKVTASVVCSDDIMATLHCGIGAVNPNASTSGQASNHDIMLCSGNGGFNFDQVVSFSRPGVIDTTDFSQRSLVFFVTFLNPTAASIQNVVEGAVTVERMISPMPRFHDRRIG